MSDLTRRAWRIFKFKRWFMFALALVNLFPAAWILVHAPAHPVLAIFNAAEWMVTWACFEAGFTVKERKHQAKHQLTFQSDDWMNHQFWQD